MPVNLWRSGLMNNQIKNINQVYDDVEKLSLFDLKRLSSAIYNLLEDPKRNLAVKKCLKVGMTIYYESPEQELIEAVILDVRKTMATVKRVSDNSRWDIYLFSINLNGQDLISTPKRQSGNLDRNSLKIGDRVGYHSKNGNDVFGVIQKLNPKKTVVLLNDGQIWNVPYGLLFLVMDGVSVDVNDCLLIEGVVLGR